MNYTKTKSKSFFLINLTTNNVILPGDLTVYHRLKQGVDNILLRIILT